MRIPLRAVFAAILAGCAALLAAAIFYFQDQLGLDPCPMCILSRYTFITIAAVSLTCVAVLLAWAARGSFRRRTMVIALAPPIAVVANGLRIAVTGMASEVWGPGAARGAWHETTGWVTFLVSVAVLTAIHHALNSEADAVLHPRMAEA